MSKLNLNVTLYDGRKIDIEVESSDKWKNVKQALELSIDVVPEKLVLLLESSVCKDEESLKDSFVTENSVIHCFIDKGARSVPKMNQTEALELEVNLFQIISRSNFENFVEKLKSTDKLSELVEACPAVLDDPECLAIGLDPPVLSGLLYDKKFNSLLEERPILARFLKVLYNLAKDEESTTQRRALAGIYPIDEFSDDDEDMEMDQDESGRSSGHSNSQSRSIDFLPITPDQLTAALANATGSSNSQSALSASAPRSGLPTPPSTSTPFNTPGLASSSVTGGASPGTSAAMPTEVFSQALQTALAASSRRAGTTSNTESSGSSEQSRDNTRAPPEYLEYIQLMREMGINDDIISVEALRATNGDVQAAINLIFAQWMSEN